MRLISLLTILLPSLLWSATIGEITPEQQREMVDRTETRRYQSFGLGPSWMPSLDSSWQLAYALHSKRIWEVHRHGAITLLSDHSVRWGDFAYTGNLQIGGRYFLTATTISPFAGAGLGLGFATDMDHAYFGFDVGAQIGVVFFRTAGTQLELFGDYNVLLDDGGKHRLLVGVAINY